MIKVLIFDLDDTLISESDYVFSGYHAVSEYLSQKHCLDKIKLYNNMVDLFKQSPKNLFNRLLEENDILYTSDDIKQLVQVYRTHIPSIQLKDFAFDTLKELKYQGYKLGMITDGYSVTQHNKLKVLPFENLFDNIIVTDDLGRDYWKPHPLSFEKQKEFFNVAFEEMAYIGDNPAKDFYIKRHYPICTIRLLEDGVHSKNPYLEELKEDYTIQSIKDLPELLNDINK